MRCFIFIAALIVFAGCGGGGGHHGGGGVGVVSAPAWSSPAALDRGFNGKADDRLLAVTGGQTPLTVTVLSGALPNGISVTNTTGGARVSGTPSLGGLYSFALTVTDAAGLSATQTFSWRISDPIVIDPTLPPATKGTAYSAPLTATGGMGGPYTNWQVANGGTAPPGLALSSGGVLTGTPTTSGSFSFVVTCTDSGTDAGIGVRSFTLTIP